MRGRDSSVHRTGIRSVTIIHAADGYAVDQVPIKQIEPGDTVLTHLPDGSAYTFVVDVKRFNIDKTAGTAAIGLQAARETDNHGTGVVASGNDFIVAALDDDREHAGYLAAWFQQIAIEHYCARHSDKIGTI